MQKKESHEAPGDGLLVTNLERGPRVGAAIEAAVYKVLWK